MRNNSWVIAMGSPFTGMTLIGPFLTPEDCTSYMVENKLSPNSSFDCVLLSPPFPIELSKRDEIEEAFGPDEQDEIRAFNAGAGQ
jgi:hypothetical protein